MSLETKPSRLSEQQDDDDETVVYLGDEKPVILKKPNQAKKTSIKSTGEGIVNSTEIRDNAVGTFCL